MVLITKQDLIKELSISRSTLHRLTTHQGLPYMKVGAKIFFNRHEVEDFFRKHSSHVQNKINNER